MLKHAALDTGYQNSSVLLEKCISASLKKKKVNVVGACYHSWRVPKPGIYDLSSS